MDIIKIIEGFELAFKLIPIAVFISLLIFHFVNKYSQKYQ